MSQVSFVSGRVHSVLTLPGLGGIVPDALVSASGAPTLLIVRDMPAIASATFGRSSGVFAVGAVINVTGACLLPGHGSCVDSALMWFWVWLWVRILWMLSGGVRHERVL